MQQEMHTAARPSSQSIDALYITYDGILEPLGQSQVLEYLLPIAGSGIRLELISFEKTRDLSNDAQVGKQERVLREHGIRWIRLRYHAKPKSFSTALDIAMGIFVAVRRVRATNARLVHARSYVAALIALVVKWITHASFLFDMRGFWPEERVDLGIFRKEGFLFTISKWFEKHFLREADAIIVLTNRAKQILNASTPYQVGNARIEVIPCCVNLTRFPHRQPASELAARHGLSNKVVIGNLGAVSGRYLMPEMFRFMARLRQEVPEVRFVYLTCQDTSPLFRIAAEEGFPAERLVVTSATTDEIPSWLTLFQYGLFFPKPSYSAQAMCPTKFGELLAAGVPVVTNTGVGDVEEIMRQEDVGILLRGFSKEDLTSAARQVAATVPVSSELRHSCVEAAARHFALGHGVSHYLSVYEGLLDAVAPPQSSVEALP